MRSIVIALLLFSLAFSASISLEPPTPANGTSQIHNSIYINASASGTGDISAFIDLNRSLVGYWGFDNMSENTTYDSSTYGMNGTIYGATNTTGKFGNALDFPGTNSYNGMEIANSTLYIFTDFTYSVWINPVYTNGWRTIIDLDDDRQLLALYNSQIAIYGRCSDAYGPSVSPGEWSHIAWAVSGADYKVYLNGAEVMSGSGCSPYASGWYFHPVIGGGYSGTGYFNEVFSGTIDEVGLWNRALSEDEIKSLYNASAYRLEANITDLALGNYSFYAFAIDSARSESMTETRDIAITGPAVDFVAPTTANGNEQLEDYIYVNVSVSGINNISSFVDFNRSLMGYWSFDNVSGATVYDSSTYGNNGEIAGAEVLPGKFGAGISFNGSSDAAQVSVNLTETIGDNFTFETWVYFNDLSISWQPLFAADGTGGPGLWVSSTGQIDFWSSDFDVAAPASTLSANTWYHIVAISKSDNASIYINGVLAPATSSPRSSPTFTNFKIGGSDWAGEKVNGTLDEVRIWNRALSEEEINASYDASLYRLERNFINLSVGNYSFYASAMDSAGTTVKTETRNVSVVSDSPTYYLSSCRALDTANAKYYLTANVGQASTCFDIQADNITLDCQGHSISGTQSYQSKGIYMGARTNTTVSNCRISSYYYGLYMENSNEGHFSNISTSGNYQSGTYVTNSNNNSFLNISSVNDRYYSLYLYYSSDNNFTTYSASGSTYWGSAEIENSNNNRFSGFSIHDNEGNLRVSSSSGNTFSDLSIYDVNHYGLELSSNANYNVFSNISIHGNARDGIYSYSADYNNFSNIASYSNTRGGVYFYNSHSNIFSNVSVYRNFNEGFRLQYCIGNTIANSTIQHNSYGSRDYYQIYIYENSNLVYNNIIDNSSSGMLAYSAGGTNFWNTTLSLGTNIMGGPYIGGNYYSGYSAADADLDSIGDVPFALEGGSDMDYLPLLKIGPEFAFASPTPSNNSIISRNWAYINTTVSDATYNISECVLEWNGVNETMGMQGSGNSVICYANKSVSDGQYSFRVYANNTNSINGDSGVISFAVDTTATSISFIPSTPSSGLILDYNPEINASITGGALDNIAMNWNNANYSFYDDSLVLMMNFDNNSNFGEGATVYDFSRYANHGTLHGATYQSGKYGNSVRVNNNYVEITASSAYDADNLTIEAWVYINSMFYNYKPILVKNDNRYLFWLHSDGSLEFSGGSFYFRTCSGTFQTGRWYHLIGTRENSQAPRLYINGVEDTSPCGVGSWGSWTESGGNIWLGKDVWEDDPFNGKVDELRIWDRIISPEEAKQHYYSNLRRFNSSQWYLEGNISDDGVYQYSMWANSSGVVVSTETRALTVDRLAPQMQFTANSELNDSILLRRHAYFEISYSEATRQYAYLNLDNGSSYSMNCNSTACWLNKTLKLGNYLYNISMGDYFNRTNATETRNITINMTATTFSFVMVNKLTSVIYLEGINLDGNTMIFSPTIFFAPLERKIISFEVDGSLCDAPGDILQFNNVIIHYQQGNIDGMAQVGSIPLSVQCS